MKFLVQRSLNAKVEIDGRINGQIQSGYVVFIGICNEDTMKVADKMVSKLLNLRIFEDYNGKSNLSLLDVGGEILLISQFTLYADTSHGNRPSYINAGDPGHALELYEYVLKQLTELLPGKVAHGEFGAEMKVSLLNDGPFTILLDSSEYSIR